MRTLIFDQPREGHHRRYAEVLSRVLGGTSLIQPISRALPRLIFWRGPLVCDTIGNYVLGFLIVSFCRHLLGRRTVAVLIRSPRTRWTVMKFDVRRFLYDLVTGLPSVRVLSILAPASADTAKGGWIYDVEWWDLRVAPLLLRDPKLPDMGSAHTVMFLGNARARKGTAFFSAVAARSAQRGMPLRFVFVGTPTSLEPADRATFQDAGGIFVPRTEDDSQFVSYLRAADWIWCCYRPDWDGSSGLFGRALQMGKRCIIRRGSYLDEFQRLYGNGIAVSYGDADALLDELMKPPMPLREAPIADFAEFSIRRLRLACLP